MSSLRNLKSELTYISIGFIIFSICCLLYNSALNIDNIIDGCKYFSNVILYLFSITFLRVCLTSLKLSLSESNVKRIYFYNFISSFAFGLATPAFIKTLYPGTDTSWLTRWVCISMFFLPTTVASAYLFENINPPFWGIFCTGIILCPIFFWLFPIKLVFNKIVIKLLGMSFINILLIILLHWYLKFDFLVSQAIVFISISILIVSAIKLHIGTHKNIIIKETLDNSLFFIAMGLLMIGILHSKLYAYFNNMEINSLVVSLIFAMVIIPLITVCFIHPLMLYSLFGGKLNILFTYYFNSTQIYIIWVFIFIFAQLCSPASIATILAARVEKESIFKVSLFRNMFFCIKMLFIVIFFISISTIVIKHIK